MSDTRKSKAVVNYWLKHYAPREVCALCGNSGILDTRKSAVSPSGNRVGGLFWCICPNGQWRRKGNGGSPPAPTKQSDMPKEPDIALLASMATCLNHGFGLLDFDGQQRMLIDMRKLYDEVAGNGYYSPANRDRYLEFLAAAIAPSKEAGNA